MIRIKHQTRDPNQRIEELRSRIREGDHTGPTSGVALGWERNLRGWKFQAVWAVIIVVGTVLAATETDPVTAILFAQAANGVLLPVIAVFLLIVMNSSNLLGEFRNGAVANILGGLVVLVATGLGVYFILSALGIVG